MGALMQPFSKVLGPQEVPMGKEGSSVWNVVGEGQLGMTTTVARDRWGRMQLAGRRQQWWLWGPWRWRWNTTQISLQEFEE